MENGNSRGNRQGKPHVSGSEWNKSRRLRRPGSWRLGAFFLSATGLPSGAQLTHAQRAQIRIRFLNEAMKAEFLLA